MTAVLTTIKTGDSLSDADVLAGLRAKCRAPVSRVEQLRWVAGDVASFVANDLDPLRDLDPSDEDGDTQAEPLLFANAAEAVEGLQLVEQLRRQADAIAVQVMDDVTTSRVVDEHGHRSARNMYDAATHQSGRDLHAMEQIRKMFVHCEQFKTAARESDLSWDHLRLLARIYSNRRIRMHFVDQQGWFLNKAARFDFRRFEFLANQWEEIVDQDGPEPEDTHAKRNATATQDFDTKNWQRRNTQSPLIGAAMAEIEQAYIEAEFVKDWEAAKAIHGDNVCKDLLARTDAQRRADAVAQIYADAAANPNKSMPFNIVHVMVWTEAEHHEMARRYAGATPRPLDIDAVGVRTIDGRPLDRKEAFIDSLTSGFRRAIIDAKGVTIDLSDKRFFTGLSRLALQINHDECEWIGCHVPASRCEADHIESKARGGPTNQVNGSILCKRHNRHKERGYTVWRDQTTGQLRIKTPTGQEITRQ